MRIFSARLPNSSRRADEAEMFFVFAFLFTPLSLHRIDLVQVGGSVMPVDGDDQGQADGRFRRRDADGKNDEHHTVQRLGLRPDRKSTRLNSSHGYISYAVF